RMQELGYGANGRVSEESAPTYGQELGAQTLIVGRYRFDCTGVVSGDAAQEFVKADTVYRQSLKIWAFDLESGRIVADLELYLDQQDSAGQLLPRSLGTAAAKRFLDGIGATKER